MELTRKTPANLGPGLILATLIGIAATWVGSQIPLVGGPVTGVVAGVVLTLALNPVKRWPGLSAGVKFASSRVLQTAVVLLGAQASISEVVRIGWQSLPVMLGTLVACLAAAYFLGKAFGIDRELVALVGVGTAICGASAIAAITPVLKPAARKVAYALSTVFVFNIAAVLLFPWVGHLLGMSQTAFGVFAGTAVNDTSSVVAAAATFGAQATDVAAVVKLARTLMIIPISIALALLVRKIRTPQTQASGESGSGLKVWTLVPWFLVGFLLLTVISPLLPEATISLANTAAVVLITIALSAIGLSTDVQALIKTGPKALILGGILWLVVTLTSLGIQSLTGGLT
ncbi:MAG TPA: putative sulfate exporter family transporter [Beutenbergiaceae bacterium]|nr:putative sulfate exporter family transporter [Beutenbergiaceae bacterium]